MRRALLWVTGVALGSAALLVGVAAIGLTRPADPMGEPLLFEVDAGESLIGVARRLSDAGLLREGGLFGPSALVIWARIRGADREIKSGEYELSGALSPLEILAKITAGRVKTWSVTLPEGLTLEEVAQRIDAAGIADAAELVARARNPELAQRLGFEAGSLEGYLYPETYRFRRGTEPDEVIERMTAQFRLAWLPTDRAALGASGLTLHQVVTLASIVEKETGAAEERPRIAAVFHNRLARGMRLQSDPTVIYGVLREHGVFDGNIRRRDLEADTAYNTYTRSGLPPGPISSVSMASIRAVLSPEDVPYLYFVSQNDGTHYFSTTLREHVNAVNRYQKRRRKAGES